MVIDWRATSHHNVGLELSPFYKQILATVTGLGKPYLQDHRAGTKSHLENNIRDLCYTGLRTILDIKESKSFTEELQSFK